MKIKDVLFSAGKTGFFFDDQAAIKKEPGKMDLFILDSLLLSILKEFVRLVRAYQSF